MNYILDPQVDIDEGHEDWIEDLLPNDEFEELLCE